MVSSDGCFRIRFVTEIIESLYVVSKILVFILNTYGFCNSENIGYNIIIYGL